MKKGTILALLLAAALAISPLGVFAADDAAAADGAQETQMTELGSANDHAEDEAITLAADDQENFSEDEDEAFRLGAGADTITPGEWNSSRTQYLQNGVPVKGLFVAPKKDGVSGAGLYFADSTGYVVGASTKYIGKVTPTSGPYYALNNGSWQQTETAHSYYINSESDPCMVEKKGAYGGATKYFVNDKGYIKTSVGVATAANGDRYYVESGGTVKTSAGFVKYSDYTYYVQDGGKIRLKEGTFKDVNGKMHLVTGSSGHVVVKKGFNKHDGKIYYMSGSNGTISVNKTLTVKKKKYHINSKGVVQTGLHTWKSAKYLASDKGALYTKGVHKSGSKRYFVTNSSGKIAVKEKITYKGKTYFASKDAHLLTGVILWYNNKYYYCYDSGAMMTKAALFKADGKWYYNKKGGSLAKSKFVTLNYKHYYAGDKAAILTRDFKYSGHTMHPDRDDGEIPFKDWNAIHGNKWKYNKYVSVSISGQSLVLYRNGEKVVSCSIISGSPGTSYATKTGTYKVHSKSRNHTAKYEGKKFNIEYYINYSSDGTSTMAFGDGPYWVSSYGGSKYRLDGSMGEILMPYNPAITLYNNVDVGTHVVIH